MSAAAALEQGYQIGEYVLGEVLGEGSTSVVYACSRAGAKYAMKVLRAQASTEGAMKAALLFRKEASVIARLNHPSLVRIVEIGEQDGVVFMVMERVEIPSLSQLLRQGPLDEPMLCKLGTELAGTLAYVH